jgi:hypothetical protein
MAASATISRVNASQATSRAAFFERLLVSMARHPHARAEQSPTMTALKELVHRLTGDPHDLGVFAFEPSIEENERILDAFRSMAARFAG